MGSAVELQGEFDRTALPGVIRYAVILGAIEALVVVLMAIITRLTGGIVEAVIGGLVLIAALAVVAFFPGTWTRARTIEGIAGAAGIGLAATAVFLLFDVAILQPVGVYTNRWLEIGGGSNWWYHPVWWMVGTFIPWMGALMLAARVRRGQPQSIVQPMLLAVALSVVFAIAAIVIHVPHAGWSLGTFGVAFLPGIAAGAAITSWRAARA